MTKCRNSYGSNILPIAIIKSFLLDNKDTSEITL